MGGEFRLTLGTGFKPYSLRNKIPGVTGKRVPGAASAKLPRIQGFLKTNVPTQGTSSKFREYHRQQVRDVSGKFGSGWGFAWQGLDVVSENVLDLPDRIDKSLEEAANKLAEEMLQYAKDNAPWQDHPGVHEDARENLQAVVVKEPNHQFSIHIGHGKNVYYGIWLEVKDGGKFAIILPTVYAFAPTIGDRIRLQT